MCSACAPHVLHAADAALFLESSDGWQASVIVGYVLNSLPSFPELTAAASAPEPVPERRHACEMAPPLKQCTLHPSCLMWRSYCCRWSPPCSSASRSAAS